MKKFDNLKIIQEWDLESPGIFHFLHIKTPFFKLGFQANSYYMYKKKH